VKNGMSKQGSCKASWQTCIDDARPVQPKQTRGFFLFLEKVSLLLRDVGELLGSGES